MAAFICSYRFCLWYEFAAIFTIIIRPAVYFRYFTRPVTVTRADWRCPFQRVGTPWVLRCHPSSFKNRVEEVKYKQQLHRKYNHSNNRDKPVQSAKLVKTYPVAVIKVAAGQTSQTFVVHWPENKISANHSYPEMDISHGVIEIAAIHFWIPVINTGKHSKERSHTHYNMEMRNYKISIVQVNIQ